MAFSSNPIPRRYIPKNVIFWINLSRKPLRNGGPDIHGILVTPHSQALCTPKCRFWDQENLNTMRFWKSHIYGKSCAEGWGVPLCTLDNVDSKSHFIKVFLLKIHGKSNIWKIQRPGMGVSYLKFMGKVICGKSSAQTWGGPTVHFKKC